MENTSLRVNKLPWNIIFINYPVLRFSHYKSVVVIYQ